MLLVLVQTLLGLILSVGGFFLGYFYVSGIDQGRSPLLLIPSLLIVGGGVYLLFRAGATDNYLIKKPKNDQSNTTDLENRLKKNNAMTSEWAKTTDDRNRLRLLEASAPEENK